MHDLPPFFITGGIVIGGKVGWGLLVGGTVLLGASVIGYTT